MISGAYADPACQFFSTRSVTNGKKSSSKLEIGRALKLMTSCDFKISSKLLILKFAALSSSARRTVALHSRDARAAALTFVPLVERPLRRSFVKTPKFENSRRIYLHLFVSIYIAILAYYTISIYIYLHQYDFLFKPAGRVSGAWFPVSICLPKPVGQGQTLSIMSAWWNAFLLPVASSYSMISSSFSVTNDQSNNIMYPRTAACTCWVGACEYFVQNLSLKLKTAWAPGKLW